MKPILLTLAALLAAAGVRGAQPAQNLASSPDRANALPLALDDAFEFRKTKIFLNNPQQFKPTTDPMIAFERQRVNFGALTSVDRRQRMGNYYTFFWRAKRKADLTLRFEFRQQKLGSAVTAMEIVYPAASGSYESKFQVTGDSFNEEGKVTAWRAVLVENGRIVGLTPVFPLELNLFPDAPLCEVFALPRVGMERASATDDQRQP